MLALLLEAALRSLALGGVVWLGLRLLRVRDPRVHMTAWTVVLVASLSMPLLMRGLTVTIPAAAPPQLVTIPRLPPERMADALDAGWTVVYVETPALLRLSEAERDRRIDLLRLAESLGAETVTLGGPSAAATLIEYAQTRNATRVIVGSPKRKGWRSWLQSSTPVQLIQQARGFDVITIAVSDQSTPRRSPSAGLNGSPTPIRWDRYAWAIFMTAVCTAVAFAIYPRFELSNLVMIYLLGVTIAGLRLGRGPSLLTSLLNVAAFDFFFVPPRFTFAIADVQYLVTFVVMLIIAMVIANLMASIGIRVWPPAIILALSSRARISQASATEPGLTYSNCAAFIENSRSAAAELRQLQRSIEHQAGHRGRENRHGLTLEQRTTVLRLGLNLGPFRIRRESIPRLLPRLLACEPRHVGQPSVVSRSDESTDQLDAVTGEELGGHNTDEAISHRIGLALGRLVDPNFVDHRNLPTH